MIKAVTQAEKSPPLHTSSLQVVVPPTHILFPLLLAPVIHSFTHQNSVCHTYGMGMVPLYTYHMVCGTYGMVCGTPPPCSPFVIHSFTRNTKAYYFILSCHAIHTPHHHTLLLALHFVTTGTIVLSSGTIRYGRV